MDLRKVSHFLRKVRGIPYCGAVIVAAGNASRMEGIDKILAPLEGIPVIQRTAQAFQAAFVKNFSKRLKVWVELCLRL